MTGMLSNRSIAYGIAKACHREGARARVHLPGRRRARARDRSRERIRRRPRVPLRRRERCRRSTRSSRSSAKRWDGLDGLVHAIAFAPREALKGSFHESVDARGVPYRARRLQLQPRGARQGGRPDDEGALGFGRHAFLPRRCARDAELQRDGAREGEPRGRACAISPRAWGRGHSGERDFRRDRSRPSPRPASAASRRSCISSRRTRRCAAG